MTAPAVLAEGRREVSQPRLAAIAALVIASVIWGTSFIANDAGVRILPGTVFAFHRFLVAGAASLLLALALGALRARVFREPGIWLISGLNAAGMALQYWGQERTTPARTALFVNASVFLIAFLSYLLYRERLGRGGWLAAVAAVAGVALIETGGHGLALASARLALGDALALGAGAAVSGYVVLTKAAAAGGTFTRSWLGRAGATCARLEAYPMLGYMAAIFTLTALLLFPVVLVTEGAFPPLPPVQAWGLILWTGLACTSLAYTLWTWTLRSVGATTSAVILLLEVLWAAAISVAIGRDALTAATLAGGLLVFAASVHVARRLA